ncbi:amino acid permease [Altererythrobacter aestuarii]|uniref:Arginine/agmatine antiporter n=2 Tax=Alteraurantiacibacter aestuarii TaxID=650004 RepID=A0A844ZMQ3_9SPHN|nr:amino acid permease [Alteraurantiacibacter aestuarii]MXO88127.1 amino acid permease [Alteraurantiacibacter aestuarii]
MTISLVMGNMIGSGIFLLPATLAPLGWNSIVGWLFTIAGGLCLAATFAWLARQMPVEGGPYAYTNAAFGPLPAFMVTWSYWISLWIGNAAIAVAGISYLGVFVPGMSATTGGDALAAVVLIWALTFLNLTGSRSAGGFQLVTTVIKVLPLLLVIVLAAVAMGTGEAELRPMEPGGIQPGIVTAAATLTLWALLGLESATVPAGKIRDPERTIPFATLVGTALTGLLYLVTCSAIILLMPEDIIASSGAPFADFVERFWAPGPALLIAGFAAISCFGALNGWIMVQAELPYAMARAGAFPRWFAKENAAGSPARALVVSSALMTVVVLLNYDSSAAEIFGFLLLISTACSLFMYLVCMASALRLRFGGGMASRRYLPWVAALATLYSAWTIYGAGGEAVAWGVGLLLVSLPVYALMRWRAA